MQSCKEKGHHHHGWWRWRLFILCLTGCFVAHAFVPAMGLATGGESALVAPPYPGAASAPAKTDVALRDFSTHMPILVLDMAQEALEANDFFFDGAVLAYENHGETATPVGAPGAVHTASIRNLTNKTNVSRQKCDYYLRFDEDVRLLGLGETAAYILLGARNDKSLIRNYLGYRIAAGIVADAPGFQLCEVFFRTARGDAYQGVYLLVEKNTAPAAVLFYHGTEENGISIDTYSSINRRTSGRMYIPVIESTQWDDRYAAVIGRVSTAESVLFSSNSATFYTYVDLFDVPSFANRFLLGEIMEDYVGVTEGYYEFDTDTGLFSAAPLWNFDRALDNAAADYTDVEAIRYDTGTYYEQFFKSHQFATQIQSRYLALRQGILDEKTLLRIVDEAAAYVAPAVQRDWDRWNAYRGHILVPIPQSEAVDGAPRADAAFDRQTSTYEDEILRIKFQLREHGLELAYRLTMFDFSEKEISKEIVLNANPVWLVLFLVVFFSFVRFARRYGV